MKRSVTILVTLAALLALNSILVAQKAKPKSTSKSKSCKTIPVNSPSWIECHEFEVAITARENKSKLTTTPSNNGNSPAVFEPNDEPRSNGTRPGGTAQPKKPGQIMDIVDMAKADGPSPSQPNPQAAKTTSPQNGVAPASTGKGTKNFNDIIVSSKTTKPKAKPAKSKAAKPKPQ